MITQYSVLLSGSNGNKSEGQLEIQTFSPSDKKARAFKFLGMFWGMALVSVFIPLLHFVLVPAFLILGVFVALMTHSAASQVIGGRGTCPHCQADFKIERASVKWPLEDMCSQCHRSVSITKI